MLHAWEKYGLKAAQKEYDDEYAAGAKPTNFEFVVRGKIAFIRQIRGAADDISGKLAKKFNSLTVGSKIRVGLNPKEIALGAT